MADDVTVDLDEHIATVEIHRPPNNFFDVPLIQALAEAVLGLDDDPACRVVVLCSEGKNFCAGADLGPESDLVDATADLYAEAVRLYSARKPIVAAVQGAAVGGGLGLALAADFRIASPETTFRCNFARLGFHQGFGISASLPAVVGQQRALELLYTGGQVKGEEALAIGLADRCVPADELRSTARAFAADIAAAGPLAVLAIKETMRGDLAARIQAVTAREHEAQQALRATADFAEGVRATGERRTPEFRGE
jgi:2-(1,2-epoxy-1,2-dihydrophenyl)acetyl-CoA isomerase